MKKNLALAVIAANMAFAPQAVMCADLISKAPAAPATAAPAKPGKTPSAANPDTQPATPVNPSTPNNTRPVAPGKTDPGVPNNTRPVVPGRTDPATPNNTRPTVPGGTDPSTPNNTRPTAPGNTAPSTRPSAPAETAPKATTAPKTKSDAEVTDKKANSVSEDDYVYHEEEREVVRLCNEERARMGLAPLKINWQLARMARFKAEDMRDTKNFDHESKIYGSPFEMLASFNIPFEMAGENIAKGKLTPADVVGAWLSSEGHRKNILNPNFTEIGVGYAGAEKGAYWAEIFIRPEVASVDGLQIK